MSRIGKQPIVLPSGVSVAVEGQTVRVSGPKGSLTRVIRPELAVRVDGATVTLTPVRSTRKTAAYWGLSRALIAAMVAGTHRGFEKRLEIEGIGYRASLDGSDLELAVGYSHPVRVAAPEGIAFRVERNVITVSGIDQELVGDVAARIRKVKPPEPYKGKGIRYQGEVIRRKAGKKAVSTA